MAIKSTQQKLKSVRKKKTTQDLYWFGNNPCLHPVPKQPPVLEISNNLVKSFTRKDPQGKYPPLFSFNNLVDVSFTRTDPQEMYPLLFSVTTTQVDVPSTSTTKDVPSNVLRQRILSRLVLWIFVRGNKRYLRRLVLWNLLSRGRREETKEFSGG